MNKKIVVLCSDGPHNRYLIAEVSKNFNLAGVVIEPYRYQMKNYLKRKKYVDYLYAVYHSIRRNLLGLNKYRQNYFKDIGDHQHDVEEITVDSINSPQVSEFLMKIKPDITIVMGTSIIKPHILDICGRDVINIHGGYLPDYRGNHCFFFALYNEDYEKIGSTLHYVNRGIDTGDIIEVVKPYIDKNDNAETLYCRAELLAIHRLMDLLKEYDTKGTPIPKSKQSKRGKIYLTKTRKLYHDLHYYMRKKKNKVKIPSIIKVN